MNAGARGALATIHTSKEHTCKEGILHALLSRQDSFVPNSVNKSVFAKF